MSNGVSMGSNERDVKELTNEKLNGALVKNGIGVTNNKSKDRFKLSKTSSMQNISISRDTLL